MATSFDGTTLVITLDSGITTLDVKEDLYEPWKEWVIAGNAGFPAAFRPTGGDPLTPGVNAGSYFFLQNDAGWRVRPAEEDADILVNGNLAPEDSTLPLTVPTLGGYTVLLAGLQPITQNVSELLVLQQDSQYNGKVSIDTIFGTAGTAFPSGTAAEPVNNLADAYTIAMRLGVRHFLLHGSLTLDIALPFWNIEGAGGVAAVDVNGQVCSGTLFSGCGLSGTFGTLTAPVTILDGQITADLGGFEGNIAQCSIVGNITVVGDTSLLNCASGIPGTGHPHIDFDDNVADIGIRGYSGGMGFENYTQAGNNATMDLLSGHFELESSCTAGTVVVRGVGHFTDNSVGVTAVTTGLVEGYKVDELHQVQGLDSDADLVVTDTTRDAGAEISQTVTESPPGTITVSRQ